jgi:hypothetical protein
MNVLFTPEEISRAGRIVKQAGTNRPINVDAAIQSLMGPGSYDTWLGPKSIIDSTPPPRPGFWSSLGRSTLGAIDQTVGAPVRGFFGLAPGPSGIGNLASTAPHYLWSKLTGDQANADKYRSMMGEGLVIPTQQARYQSKPYHGALADWATDKASPTRAAITKGITMPVRTFREWWDKPINLGQRPPAAPRQAPWEAPKMPPMPKPTW